MTLYLRKPCNLAPCEKDDQLYARFRPHTPNHLHHLRQFLQKKHESTPPRPHHLTPLQPDLPLLPTQLPSPHRPRPPRHLQHGPERASSLRHGGGGLGMPRASVWGVQCRYDGGGSMCGGGGGGAWRIWTNFVIQGRRACIDCACSHWQCARRRHHCVSSGLDLPTPALRLQPDILRHRLLHAQTHTPRPLALGCGRRAVGGGGGGC